MKIANVLSRVLLGHRARRVYLALLVLVILFSATLRVRTFLLTRKIHAVLSELEKVRVDETTEEQLPTIVPSLALTGGQGYYYVGISNTDDDRWMGWVPEFLYSLDPPRFGDFVENKWDALALPVKVAYILGWRHLSFGASVIVLNGTVSQTSYWIEPDVFLGAPASYFVVVSSRHGFWERSRRVPVQSTDDESPDYRFAGQFSWLTGADSAIAVAYTRDASRDLVSHAYRVDLQCFWGIRGCNSVRQVTPLLWEDRQAIENATEARFKSANPCPDRILSGRVRTLVDLDIALLEVVSSRTEYDNYEGDRTPALIIDYRLKEVIRGEPQGPWTNIRYREAVRRPFSPGGQIANPQIANPMMPLHLNPGDRFLYFGAARFDSCRMVPATPSAEAAVRSAIPAQKRNEDNIDGYSGRL